MKKRIRSLVTAILLCFFFVSADTVAASDAEYPSLKKEVETESEKEDGSARSLETDSVVYINPAYVDVTPLMCVLVLSASVNLIFRSNIANVLAATGKITSNMIVSFGGVALQMLTIIFFTGKFGAFGIAWTSVGLYVLMTIALIFPFNKFFGRKTDTLPGGTKSDGSIDNQQV